jgi:hypothetical protein
MKNSPREKCENLDATLMAVIGVILIKDFILP